MRPGETKTMSEMQNDTETSDTNRRRVFRLKELVRIDYSTVDEHEWIQRLEKNLGSTSRTSGLDAKLMEVEASLKPAVLKLRQKAPVSAECVELLNEKIQLVADKVMELEQQRNPIYKRPTQLCDLSSSGMAFAAPHGMSEGARLMLKFLLVSDSHYVETLAKVVRCQPPEESDLEDEGYKIAVEFVGMREAESEMLIRHMLSRQAEDIRTARLRALQE